MCSSDLKMEALEAACRARRQTRRALAADGGETSTGEPETEAPSTGKIDRIKEQLVSLYVVVSLFLEAVDVMRYGRTACGRQEAAKGSGRAGKDARSLWHLANSRSLSPDKPW